MVKKRTGEAAFCHVVCKAGKAAGQAREQTVCNLLAKNGASAIKLQKSLFSALKWTFQSQGFVAKNPEQLTFTNKSVYGRFSWIKLVGSAQAHRKPVQPTQKKDRTGVRSFPGSSARQLIACRLQQLFSSFRWRRWQFPRGGWPACRPRWCYRQWAATNRSRCW